MDLAAKKLAFIEEYLHLSDEKLIDKFSSMIKKGKANPEISKKSLSDFFGIMNKEEGLEFKRIIEEGTENIDPNEW